MPCYKQNCDNILAGRQVGSGVKRHKLAVINAGQRPVPIIPDSGPVSLLTSLIDTANHAGLE